MCCMAIAFRWFIFDLFLKFSPPHHLAKRRNMLPETFSADTCFVPDVTQCFNHASSLNLAAVSVCPKILQITTKIQLYLSNIVNVHLFIKLIQPVTFLEVNLIIS